MAFAHGKGGAFQLGSAGSESTLVDLSGFLDDVSFPEEVQTTETTTFGDDSRTYVVGLKDTTISLTGKFDATPDAQLAGALGNATALNFQYDPIGSTSGNPRYTGAAFITSYEISTSVDDTVTFSCDLQVTGDVTRASIA